MNAELFAIARLERELAAARRWAKVWKAAAREKRGRLRHLNAQYDALRAANTVTPLPQISALSPVTSETLNPNVFYGTQLFSRAARLLACAEEALAIVLASSPDLAFIQPMPLSATHVIFYVFKDGQPLTTCEDFSREIGLGDAQLALAIAGRIQAGLGLSTST